MSLRQSVNLPPNYIIDEREKDQKSLSQKWLEQLTERAVDKAFKLQTESRKLVDIVDTHSCGEPRMLGCSFSPLSSKILKTSSSVITPRSWVLPKNSEERRRISTRIYALLLKWRADFSFEWRARVASVVPLFEEAVYQESKTREDYNNLQLLDSQLKLVLCHFEAGNGPFLLQGITPLYPLKIPSHAGPLIQNSADQAVTVSEITTAEALPTSSSQVCTNHVQRIDQLCSSSSKCKPSHALLNTIASMSDHIDLGMHGRHGSKKIVKRVFNALSKKRIEENNRLKQELRRADRKTERMVRMFSKQEFKVPARVSDGGEALLNAQSHGGLVRSRSGKKLADILGLDVHVMAAATNERREQSINVSESTCLNDAEIMSISCRALPATSSPSSTPYGSAPASPLLSSSPSNSQASPLKSCLQSPVTSSSVSQQTQPLAKSKLNLATCSEEVESSPMQHQVHSSTSTSTSTSPSQSPSSGAAMMSSESDPTPASATSALDATSSTLTSTIDPTSSAQSRNSTIRVPLSTFLAQRDDSNPLLVMSSYEPGPWDTWEDPTEQLDPLCCVCMVGLKGAGFIPCGHTFCRKCSRELWKGRGTCPLCNRYIREILDIY